MSTHAAGVLPTAMPLGVVSVSSSSVPSMGGSGEYFAPVTTVQLTTHITTHTHGPQPQPQREGRHAPPPPEHAHLLLPMHHCIAHTTTQTQTVHTHQQASGAAGSEQLVTPAGHLSYTHPHSQAVAAHDYHHSLMHQHALQTQAHIQAQWNAHLAHMRAAAANAVAAHSGAVQVSSSSRSSPFAVQDAAHHLHEQYMYQQQLWQQLRHQQQQQMRHRHHQQQERAHYEQLQHVMQQSMDQAVLRPRGASALAISQLASRRTSAEAASEHASCTICLTEFELEEEQVLMPCRHPYHRECLKTWLQIRNTCPCCRYQIDTDDAEYNRTIRASPEATSAVTTAPPAAVRSNVADQAAANDEEYEDEDEEEDEEDGSFSEMEDDEDEEDLPALQAFPTAGPAPSSATVPSTTIVIPLPPPMLLPHLASLPLVSSSTPVSPMVQYHTLHHLQSMAAAEFSALAQQAQLQQQQQQQLIFYQQQLWQAQNDLQASLTPSAILAATSPSSRISSASTLSPRVPASAHVPPHPATATVPLPTRRPSFHCSLCSTSPPVLPLHPSAPSCALSCGHSYHVSCWSSYLLQQHRYGARAGGDPRSAALPPLASCPQCHLNQQRRAHAPRRHSELCPTITARSPTTSHAAPLVDGLMEE